jgi:hypothetical protein
MPQEDEVTRMARVMDALAKGYDETAREQLHLLMSEMEALLKILPGVPPKTEAELRAEQEAVEASFDNMPV